MNFVHGVRHGKSEVQTYYYLSFNAWKSCRKKTDESANHEIGILDRFLKDARDRESQQKLGWTEAKCQEMDDLAQEDHTYKATKKKLDRYRFTLDVTVEWFNI